MRPPDTRSIRRIDPRCDPRFNDAPANGQVRSFAILPRLFEMLQAFACAFTGNSNGEPNAVRRRVNLRVYDRAAHVAQLTIRRIIAELPTYSIFKRSALARLAAALESLLFDRYKRRLRKIPLSSRGDELGGN
jgi:hypothetical protein